jgi:hypothetical protein
MFITERQSGIVAWVSLVLTLVSIGVAIGGFVSKTARTKAFFSNTAAMNAGDTSVSDSAVDAKLDVEAFLNMGYAGSALSGVFFVSMVTFFAIQNHLHQA